MNIVDAQIHIWSQGIPTNAAHRQVSHYTAEECLKEMDAGGVDAALIHPPGWDPNSIAVAEAAAALPSSAISRSKSRRADP
jgi:predicted TIM-barrel fold metal-dependent hydrolase